MASVAPTRVDGGAGLKSSEVNVDCGLHKNWATTTTVIDLSAATATVNLFVAPSAGVIQRVLALYPEAISADGDGTIVCGSLLYSSGALVTDADKYATFTPTASSAIGTVEVVTATSTTQAFVQGEIITVGHTQKTGAGTAQIMVEYTIDDEFN